MKKILVHIYIALKIVRDNFKVHKNKEFEASLLESRIIRYLHSIEKGLSLEQPRPGFGIKKIEVLFGFINEYKNLNGHTDFCLLMARDAIKAYLDFHNDINFENEQINLIKQKWQELNGCLPESNEIFGGISELTKEDMNFNVADIEKLFKTRHSIREFSGEKVSEEDIKKAISLAQMCPSACNRQCTRIYSVSSKKYMNEMKTDLGGIGGFADNVDRFLLITAKKTAYELDEVYQYAVSASIFAGYLTLALHTYGIATCMVQRSMMPNSKWDGFRSINKISDDEQIVVMIAVGKYKETTTVPISKRYPIDSIYKNLGE